MDILEDKEKYQRLCEEFEKKIRQEQEQYNRLINVGVQNLDLLEKYKIVHEDLYNESETSKKINKLLEDLYIIYSYCNQDLIKDCTDMFQEYKYYIKYNNNFYEYHIMYGQGSESWVKKAKGKNIKKFIELTLDNDK